MSISAYIEISYNAVTGSADDPPCDFIRIRIDDALLRTIAEIRREAVTNGYGLIQLPADRYSWCQLGLSFEEMRGGVSGFLANDSPRLFEDEPRGNLALYVPENGGDGLHASVALKIHVPETGATFMSEESFTPDTLVASVAEHDRLSMIDMCVDAFREDPVEMDMLLRSVIQLDDHKALARLLPAMGDRLGVATGPYTQDRRAFWIGEQTSATSAVMGMSPLTPELVAKAYALQRELQLGANLAPANSPAPVTGIRSRL